MRPTARLIDTWPIFIKQWDERLKQTKRERRRSDGVVTDPEGREQRNRMQTNFNTWRRNMKNKLSRRWWISIGVTVVLAALLGATGAALAHNSAGDLAPGSILAPGGGPSEAMAFTYQGR